MRTPDSEKLYQRLIKLREILRKLDDKRIGTAAAPEIIDCSFEERTATFCYPFCEWMLNYGDVMHGGIVALFADTSMGLLASAYPDGKQFTPTVTLNISYLNPIPLKDRIVIKAHLQQVTHKIIYVRCDFYFENDMEKELASASGTYYRKPVQ